MLKHVLRRWPGAYTLLAYAALLCKKQEPQTLHASEASLRNAARANDALQLSCTPTSHIKVVTITQHFLIAHSILFSPSHEHCRTMAMCHAIVIGSIRITIGHASRRCSNNGKSNQVLRSDLALSGIVPHLSIKCYNYCSNPPSPDE